MPLLDLWNASPQIVGTLNVEQIVANAGNGTLKDDSDCSKELRSYLSQASSERIADYIEHCLTLGFVKSGFVLQDLVNELGRRLEYAVSNGRYQGIPKAVGFDGLWRVPGGHSIVVEVKTTDAYRVPLNTIIEYRQKLIAAETISGTSSVLIVVGREDTGELEAQVRGSRHAWDIRLISADALVKLVRIKEEADGFETVRKIQSLLAPMEYTRLDQMIDVMFTATQEVAATASELEDGTPEGGQEVSLTQAGVQQYESAGLVIQSIQDKRERVVAAVSRRFDASFIKKSRALLWSVDHNIRLACTLSKRYDNKGDYKYWFAYHPQWHQFLSEGQKSFLVLGGMDLSLAFALPLAEIGKILPALNTTTRDNGEMYWHIIIGERLQGRFTLLKPKVSSSIDLMPFTVKF